MSWPFETYVPPADFSEPEYVDLANELRRMLAALAEAAPDRDLTRELTGDLQRWRKELEACRGADGRGPYGQLAHQPDHGLAFLPEVALHLEEPGQVQAAVTFTRWHVGGGDTIHGGQVATVLDELMGRSALAEGWICRTAYLTVNYRAGTPYDRRLQVEARVVRAEGRKRFVEARLFDDDATYAEADGLFIRVARYPDTPPTADDGILESS